MRMSTAIDPGLHDLANGSGMVRATGTRRRTCPLLQARSNDERNNHERSQRSQRSVEAAA